MLVAPVHASRTLSAFQRLFQNIAAGFVGQTVERGGDILFFEPVVQEA
jgi:hypothetical protein